jgi:hypothetical protein
MEHPFGRGPEEGASCNQCLGELARRTSIAPAIANCKPAQGAKRLHVIDNFEVRTHCYQ